MQDQPCDEYEGQNDSSVDRDINVSVEQSKLHEQEVTRKQITHSRSYSMIATICYSRESMYRCNATYLIVLMARHHHKANVRRRQGALEQRNALTARQSNTCFVR